MIHSIFKHKSKTLCLKNGFKIVSEAKSWFDKTSCENARNHIPFNERHYSGKKNSKKAAQSSVNHKIYKNKLYESNIAINKQEKILT